MKIKLLGAIIALMILSLPSVGQFTTTIPLNPEVRYGKLDNGMTYYIMHNEEPKQRASFFFVQNVGAILEEDNQNGLAHFLEHMAFNGTKNFEGKGILETLEAHGLKFGRNINAYTSLDETVYNVSDVPVDNEKLIDTCLMVLHDWSGFLSLREDEIDAERGVVREEYRTRRNVRKRLMDQTRKVMFWNSKYAHRDVIGSLDVIENFTYQTLKDYYNKWYRPDLQAVVVVGDIDIDVMEKKVRDAFSSIAPRENPVPRPYFNLPAHKDLKFCFAQDAEANSMDITLLYKRERSKVKDETYQRNGIVESICQSMIMSRFQEVLQDTASANLDMQAGFWGLNRIHRAFYLYIKPKRDRIDAAFEQVMEEMERVKRYGFTSEELARTKKQWLRSYESYYIDRARITNDKWAKNLQTHFLKSEPVTTVEYEYMFAKELIPEISLEEVNGMSKTFMTDENRVLTVTAPHGEECLSREEFLSIMERVKNKSIDPYSDEAGNTPLISRNLKGGTVKSTFEIPNTEAKGFILSNGVKVVLLPTIYSKDEVLMSAFSFGGTSLLSADDLPSADAAAALVQESGLGEFDVIQLRKKLAGQLASVSPYVGPYTEGFKGSASPRDLETLMQLIWLNYSQPRFDASVFENQMSRRKNYLVNLAADNRQAFQDSITMTTSSHHPRVQLFTKEYLDNMNMDRAKAIFKERFANAGDFTFVFVGNIDVEKTIPLIKKYLAGLPSNEQNEKWVDNGIRAPKGEVVNSFSREMETPKASVFFGVNGKIKYNIESRIKIKMISELLNKRYLETVRESEGGSYGVSIYSSVSMIPYEYFQFQILFDCDPAKEKHLSNIIKEEIRKIADNGPIPVDLEKIKMNMKKMRAERQQTDKFWRGMLVNHLMTGEQIIVGEEYDNLIDSISGEELQQLAKRIFKKPNIAKVVMAP